MYEKCIIYIVQLVLVTSTVALDVKSTESSKDYLRKVMIELQQLKSLPSSATIYSGMNFPAGKRLSGSKINFLPTSISNKHNREKDLLAMETNHQYHHQFSAPIVVPESSNIAIGEPVGFTKNQLAAIYKQALGSGSVMSLSALKNALDSGHYPSVAGNQLQIPIPQQQQQQHQQQQQQQLYTYHFYPLRSFMDKLQDNNGYKTIDDFHLHQTQDAFGSTNKQVEVNPLFMAVSSFIGMALLFMFGVIFLPRIFGEFKSRVVHDEFLNLTQTVTEAIDNYNLTTMRPKTRFSGSVVGIKTRPSGIDGGTTVQKRKTRPVAKM